MAVSSFNAVTGYAQGGLNTEIIKRINMDGAAAYDLKGGTEGVTANDQTFDAGRQDEFLKARADQVRLNREKQQQDQLQAMRLRMGR